MNNSKNYWERKKLKKYQTSSNVSLFRFLGEYGFKFKNKKVLELGFFHGADLLEFKKRESKVFGIDINSSAVKNLQKIFPKKQIKKIDLGLNRIPFLEKFDLIYSRDFIYYLNNKEIIFHLDSVFNSLKKGGLYLFQFIEKDFIYSKSENHNYCFKFKKANKSFAEKNNPVKFFNSKYFEKLLKDNNFNLVGKKFVIESYGIKENKVRINKYLLCKK